MRNVAARRINSDSSGSGVGNRALTEQSLRRGNGGYRADRDQHPSDGATARLGHPPGQQQTHTRAKGPARPCDERI
jgi:hypothetical protein